MAKPFATFALVFTVALLVCDAQGLLLQRHGLDDVSAGQGLISWGLGFCLYVLIASLANAIHHRADWPSPSAPLPKT